MISQYGEHLAILKHFEGRTGRFLDIGAFDGRTFSNTWPLAQLGWSGVCVEPSPPAFCHLMQAYKGNTDVQLVCAALVPWENGLRLQKLHCNTADAVSADMMSSLDPAHAAKWSGHPFRQVWTNGTSWEEIRDSFGANFDFINIDVEGTNLKVLKDMTMLPEMICYEWDQQLDGDEPRSILWESGYHYFESIGGNLLAWRDR